MAAHVSISLGVTGVIALLDGLEQLVRVNNFIYEFRNALISQNNETRAMLMSETNPVGLIKVFITLTCFSVLNIGGFCHHHLLSRYKSVRCHFIVDGEAVQLYNRKTDRITKSLKNVTTKRHNTFFCFTKLACLLNT